MLNSRDVPAAGKFLVQASTEQPVAEVGDRDNDTITTSRILRSSSAGNSFNPMGGKKCLKNYGADQQRLQISELQSDKIPTPPTFSCWKIRFKTEVCICSSYPTEVMTRIKEVEMVNSVHDLKSSCFFQGCALFPDFELLDARIASALNKIIQNSFFKKMSVWRNKRLRKQNQVFRGRQIAYLIYDCFQITGVNDSVLDFADLFTVVLRNDNIQESLRSSRPYENCTA